MISIQVSFFPVCHLMWINRIEIYLYIGQILKIQKLAILIFLTLSADKLILCTNTELFFASFQIQRRWVFAVKPRKQEETVHV